MGDRQERHTRLSASDNSRINAPHDNKPSDEPHDKKPYIWPPLSHSQDRKLLTLSPTFENNIVYEIRWTFAWQLPCAKIAPPQILPGEPFGANSTGSSPKSGAANYDMHFERYTAQKPYDKERGERSFNSFLLAFKFERVLPTGSLLRAQLARSSDPTHSTPSDTRCRPDYRTASSGNHSSPSHEFKNVPQLRYQIAFGACEMSRSDDWDWVGNFLMQKSCRIYNCVTEGQCGRWLKERRAAEHGVTSGDRFLHNVEQEGASSCNGGQ
ncbi:uncharacterized protein BJ212DRAFT_1302283 [Suillus subaureus]|uniref:Uncharacterized protein n=1 Tax=Suillus subaureus TaxID=48587 RepID=A0A9P7E568_9AGAM|nr:uncharacterized protein BJ212DRAFT_1302283 [Suillus subaureus]KAG1810977.1 hypothetical protein BJ212DRAFT_1302283 [Suillus subaureus]